MNPTPRKPLGSVVGRGNQGQMRGRCHVSGKLGADGRHEHANALWVSAPKVGQTGRVWDNVALGSLACIS